MVLRVPALLALAVALATCGREARAHAVLLGTSPPDGAVVERAPAEVKLKFNEPVAPVFVRLFGHAGEIAAAEPHAAGAEVRLELAGALPDGGYLVSWRAVSADSHPVAGSFAFSVGRPAPRPAAQPGAANDADWRFAKIVLRLVQDAAVAVAAGGALFGVFVLRGAPAPSGTTVTAAIAAAVAMASAISAVGVQGGVMRLGPAPILFDVATWRLGASTTVGDGAAALCGGFFVAGLAWACRFRWLAAVAAIAAASSPALSGHSATATWPTQIALAVHTMCVSYWLGSLWPLHAILRAMPAAEAARIVQRFSAIAVPAVALLGACGIWVAASRIDDPGLAFTSGYGRLLVVKLALVLALVAVAAVNRRRVTPSLARGSHAAARTLRRNIAVEIGLGGAVLIVAAILAHTPPPVAGLHGAHSRHDGQSHDDHLHPVDAEKTVAVESRGRVAIFAVAPGRVGANAITVELYGPDGRPLAPIEVRIAVSLPGAGIEPLERPAAPAGAGRHGLARVDMPVPGRWIIGVAALVTDFEKATFEVEVAIE